MSDEYCGRVPALNGVSDRFEGGCKVGRAEAEAKIATLQAERDALIEAIEIYERLLSTPASGEPKCPRCGSHVRHITFPIGANLPYRSCDDAWHAASGEPARKP